MKPAPFVHHAPRSVEEAVATLADVGADGKVLAGGQSLVPILNMRLAAPAHLVDINRVVRLDAIEVTEGHVRVGALVRQTRLERSDEAYAALPLLRQALVNVAHPVIRNRGTVVGSLAHADAAGELPAILVLADGVVEVVSASGSRQVAAAEFFLGPLETVLGSEELAVAARFQRFEPGTGTAFAELARRHGDYALAGVAAAVTVVDGVITRARTSFVSLANVPSVLDLTDIVAGAEPGGADWEAAAEAVQAFVEPDGDIHATADYRRMLAGELARRTLVEAAAHATSPQFLHTRAETPSSAQDSPGGPGQKVGTRPEDQSSALDPPGDRGQKVGTRPGDGSVTVAVNGVQHTAEVPARRLLSDFLRHDLRLTGTHVGCEHGVCGACTVLVDGQPMRSCLMFATTAQGHEITTVEGLCHAPDARPAPTGETMNSVQQAFIECHGLQCGFCTPGFLTTITAYLDDNPAPTEAEAREAISGNLCRCTGYQNIVNSVLRAAEIRAERHTESRGEPGDPT